MSTKKQLVWGDCFGYWRKELMPTIKDHLADLSEAEKDGKVGFFFARMLCAASGKSIKSLKDANNGKATGALTDEQLQVLMKGMRRMKQYLKAHKDVDVSDYIGEQCHRIKVDRLENQPIIEIQVMEKKVDAPQYDGVAHEMAVIAFDSQVRLWKDNLIDVEVLIDTLRKVDSVIHA